MESTGNNLYVCTEAALKAIGRIRTLYTCGCPIYLWSVRYDNGGLSINVREWKNIYSPYDVIGWPLKPINTDYGKAAIEDISMMVGSWWSRWTPMSHGWYLDSKKMQKMVVDSVIAATNDI
jgi:hypothetical protein